MAPLPEDCGRRNFFNKLFARRFDWFQYDIMVDGNRAGRMVGGFDYENKQEDLFLKLYNYFAFTNRVCN
jgi:hypothetical protein